MLPTARVTVDDAAIEAVGTTRARTSDPFSSSSCPNSAQLAVDTWMIALRAMTNAHGQVQEARLADVSCTLLEDLDATLPN
jgi:hypothetical protein